VNSCIRRQAWERIPFPEIDFGEDQAWAFEVQKAGLATGYAAEAVVRHSHDYVRSSSSPAATTRRGSCGASSAIR
jgi:cellulose synthase/poly-beta-1,6-N-acetylglucosamine synthase-like glycosyltransferase